MAINMERIKKALPVESGPGRRSVIRARSDVAEIVVDVVLRRRMIKDIAARCCVSLESLDRFRKNFITPEVEKIVLIEANKMSKDQLDKEVNEAQDDLEKGVYDILKEQKRLYRAIHQRVEDGDRDLEDALSPLMQLLRDQTKTHEALLKVYSNLKDKTTVVLSLNEHPEVAKLMDVLWVLFKTHPDAFADFQALVKEKRIALDVDP